MCAEEVENAAIGTFHKTVATAIFFKYERQNRPGVIPPFTIDGGSADQGGATSSFLPQEANGDDESMPEVEDMQDSEEEEEEDEDQQSSPESKQRATKRALAIANPPLARAETATGVEDVGALLVQAAAAAAAGERVATV